MSNTPESGEQRPASALQWIARIVAIIAAVFLGSTLVSEAIARVLEGGLGAALGPLAEIVTLIGIEVLVIAGCVLSWRREQLAGILLIVISVALAAHIVFFQGAAHLWAWSRVGFPCLVAGVLLLVSRRVPGGDGA